MAKITNGFLCGVTQSQNVPMSLSFILMREWMRERQNEIDCGWARISTFVLYRDSIVYPKLHYLSDLKGTFSSLSSLKKYFYHLSRAQVQLIVQVTWPFIYIQLFGEQRKQASSCRVLSLDNSCLSFTAISDSDLSGPEKALITQLRQAECDK